MVWNCKFATLVLMKKEPDIQFNQYIYLTKHTFVKCEQAASTAVADHDFPIDFFTINLNALIGKTPVNATIQQRATDRVGDLQHTSVRLISILAVFDCQTCKYRGTLSMV